MRDVKSRGALLKAPKAVTFSAVSLTVLIITFLFCSAALRKLRVGR